MPGPAVVAAGLVGAFVINELLGVDELGAGVMPTLPVPLLPPPTTALVPRLPPPPSVPLVPDVGDDPALGLAEFWPVAGDPAFVVLTVEPPDTSGGVTGVAIKPGALHARARARAVSEHTRESTARTTRNGAQARTKATSPSVQSSHATGARTIDTAIGRYRHARARTRHTSSAHNNPTRFSTYEQKQRGLALHTSLARPAHISAAVTQAIKKTSISLPLALCFARRET